MKYTDVKDLSQVDLNRKIRETKEKMFDAKMKNSMGQMNNPVSIRGMRRDIARLKTVLSSKSRGNT